MSSQFGMYNYNPTFYTGTDIQPDMLHIFIKPEKENKSLLAYTAVPVANWMGCLLPVASMFSGTARIVQAVKVIFKEISKIASKENIDKSELWNAFKNIFRGIVEVIPFTGITLLFFDSIRSNIYLNKINEELKEQENIAGVAIKGKVIVTVDLGKVDHVLKNRPADLKTNEARLDVFRYICLTVLEKVGKEKNLRIGMNELLLRLRNLP